MAEHPTLFVLVPSDIEGACVSDFAERAYNHETLDFLEVFTFFLSFLTFFGLFCYFYWEKGYLFSWSEQQVWLSLAQAIDSLRFSVFHFPNLLISQSILQC